MMGVLRSSEESVVRLKKKMGSECAGCVDRNALLFSICS